MNRKIDALIAERVFGHKVEHQIDGSEHDYYQNHWLEIDGEHHETWRLVPNYSTDIAAAWEVVEKLRSASIPLTLHISPKCVWFNSGDDLTNVRDFGDMDSEDTAPMAICIAALKAKGVEVSDDN